MYVAKDSPIPQNSLLPPPASCVDASNAAIELARCISVRGRLVAYNTIPTLESLAAISPGVAASAARVLPQSELARRSILSGGVPTLESSRGGGSDRRAVAPIVVPLSQFAQGLGDCLDLPPLDAVMPDPNRRPTMPAREPGSGYGYRCIQRYPASSSGMGGYAPTWGDAALRTASSPADNGDAAGGVAGGVIDWIRNNPWLVLGLVGGVVVVSASRGR